ncbi:MAG: GWxTD domain-containing protein [Bacteroidales bacterium]|nr:GWxTD domain-containing protein [Bacteroidales bacterium]
MKVTFRRTTALFIISILVMVSCSKKTTMNAIDYSDYYTSNGNFAKFEYNFFHPDSIHTSLMCRLDNMGLKYKLNKTGRNYAANYTITVKIAKSISRKEVIFSESIDLSDSLNFLRKTQLNHEFNIPIHFNETLFCIVELVDQNHKRTYSKQDMIYPYQKDGPNDIQFYDDADELILKKNLSLGDECFVKLNHQTDSIQVAIFNLNDSIPLPPFITDITPENLKKSARINWKVEDSISSDFALNKIGVYYISSTFNKNSGSFIRVFDQQFPKPASSTEMRTALRYITDNSEYGALLKQSDAKYAVDSFWMEVAKGNDDLALNLIKQYYGRMERANSLFSVSSKGWKSDRGMIYMIYGHPDVIYINDRIEEWWYGEPYSLYAEQFQFSRISLLPGLDEYHLERDPTLKNNWFRHVEMLRK